MKAKKPQLSAQEESIMLAIWQLSEPISIRSVLNALPMPQPAYTTIASIVKNLEAKGFVRAESAGKTTHYYIAIAQADYRSYSLGRMIRDYFAGDYKRAVLHLAESAQMSSEDIQELIEQIEKKR